MQRFSAILFLFVLSALPLAARITKDYTEVHVVVTDEKGQPIPKAAITLNFIRGKNVFGKKDRAQWDVKTDSKGNAIVPFIPHGKLKVQVYCKGYQTFGDEFEVAGEEQVIPVKLLVPQDQFSAHGAPRDASKPPEKKP